MSEKVSRWYTLGGNTTQFWDPTQPDEDKRTLAAGEAKQLVTTPRVSAWARNGGLVHVSEADALEILKKNKDLKKKVVEETKADKVLEAAAIKEKEADDKLKQASEKEEQSKKVLEENSALKDRVKELEAKIAEPQKPAK